MRFGFFDDTNREYVITTPYTPYPWINYLGSENLFGLISNTAGGYTFYRDARMRRMTRYRYNNVPTDMGGRYFYIHEDGEYWSPSFLPVRAALDFYECRHGMGYTRITGERNGLAAEMLFFVPLGLNAEVHQVTLQNRSDWPRRFMLFSFLEFCLWNAWDDMTNFQRNFSTGEVEIEGSTIYHKTEYRERRDHYAFYHVNAPVSGFDTDRDAFLGLMRGPGEPQVVEEGQPRYSVASGWAPIASHALEVNLAPGESRSLVFMLGYVENPRSQKWAAPNVIHKARAHELIAHLSTPERVAAEMARLRAHWDDLLSRYTLQSNDEKLNRMVNIWNPYQNMVTFNLSRSASYFESGIGRGMGFRDSSQDILGFVHLAPERARERLLDLAATQFPDGSAYHQYQPLTKRGNHEVGSGFNDDPLWLIVAVAAYIKETGDVSILDEHVPFDNDPSLAAPLFEHLRRAFHFVTNNLGPHGLPLIGRADWNDCLNLNCFSEEPGESFQTTANRAGRTAESVLLAGMFVYVGPDYARLCRMRGLDDEACTAEDRVAAMRQVVLDHGYDGDWFLRAYDFFGNKVGSRENEEGQIFIEPQGFCVMAGIGVGDGKAQRALDAVKKRMDTRHGIVLVNPPFSRYHVELGEISSYPPGYKENAGIFCHNNPWIMIAETIIGRGERAFEYWKKIAPAYREEISEIHRLEPYIYAQMIAGKDAVRHGEAKNSWLTGTAAWNFVAISQHILGIRPDWDGLCVEPCIPAGWDGFEVRRRFRGKDLIIRVENPDHVEKGLRSLALNGAPVEGGVIPAARLVEGENLVVARMG